MHRGTDAVLVTLLKMERKSIQVEILKSAGQLDDPRKQPKAQQRRVEGELEGAFRSGLDF